MFCLRSKCVFTILLCISFIHASLASAGAQTFGQQVSVAVNDSKGGAVEGAILVMIMGTTERRATTSVDGIARFNNIESGEWSLEIRKEGFAIAQQKSVVAGATVTIAATLSLPVGSQSMNVEARLGALDTTATSATRLELSLRETPATLNVVTQEMIQERGATNTMDAIDIAGGTFTSTGSGAIPGYLMRGFSGNSTTQDGIRQNSNPQSARPLDSFLLERVEVLKGPASLLAGEGGTAGTVNYVSKTPKAKFGVDSMASYGSFAERRFGVGITGSINKRLLARFDASFSDGGGYAKPSSTQTRAMSSTVWWMPTNAVTFKLSGRYTDDRVVAYYGTPFVNGQFDPRMTQLNYNMKDALSRAHNNFGRLDTEIALPGGWRLHNGFFAATQRLDWRNMESYAYNPTTQLVDVTSYFLIWRDDILVGNQTDLRKTVDILGRSVNFVTGFELQRNDMHRAKNPSNSTTVKFSLDPYAPVLPLDPQLPYLRVPDVLVNNKTFYAEAQAKLASKWSAVLGVRSEQIAVTYGLIVGQPESKNRNFYPTTGRAGLVYTASENISIYGSFSRSIEPATQFISITGCCGSATFFDLTPGRQFEFGVKGTALRGRLEGTAAVYDIQKKSIPIKTIVDGISTDQLVGKQLSRGTEFSFTARPTSHFQLTGDFAYTHALFSDFTEVVNNLSVSRDGNAPTNIPVIVWSLNPSQRIGPITVGATLRQVGGRWRDTANTLHLPSYETIDAWVAIRVGKNARLTLRGRNLGNEVYAPRASSTFARLGAPRGYEMALTSGF